MEALPNEERLSSRGAVSVANGNSALMTGIDFWISPSRCVRDSVGATIIIPAYQAEATLRRAITSALAQTMHDVEVIVADDGSTDSSWCQIVDWLAREPRLRAIRNRRNGGKSAAMNRAASFAKGRWLAVLDADDWYHPERLSALTAIGERRQVAMVADNQVFYDAPAETVIGAAWPSGAGDWLLNFDDYLRGSKVDDAFNLGMLKPVIRTEFLRSTGLSYDERVKYSEDFYYLLQFFLYGGTAAISDTPYYLYTQPFGAISRRWSHTGRSRYDFAHFRDINQIYLRETVGRLTAYQLRTLKTRSCRLASLESYFCAKEALAQREWRSFVARLIGHPAIFAHAARRMVGRYFMRSAVLAAARVAADSRRRTVGETLGAANASRRTARSRPARFL